MQVTGTIVKIKPTETIPSKTGGKDFSKREFWLQLADEKYPQTIPFQLSGDAKTDLIEPYSEGELITVKYNLTGRIWQDRCFGTLDAWNISREGATATPASSPAPIAVNNLPPSLAASGDEYSLPF